MLIAEDLFQKVLTVPAINTGVNRLQIVSGFATANMADRHMEKLAELGLTINIELIIGMTRRMGIEKAQHYALQKLAKNSHYENLTFSCRYVVRGNPVHAKTYCWLNDNRPQTAFTGSANYTLTAFGRSQIEAMTQADCDSVMKFQKQILQNTDNCLADDIAEKVTLTETRDISDAGENTVTLSLLDRRTGETPVRSGINWGQRDDRNKNQSYIAIPADIGRSDFFPERHSQFTVLTDDDYSFIMVRAQDGGKALHTTQNNAILGAYLRARMGVPSGQYVTRQNLVTYGRTNITFTKIDDETYLLDFRPNMGPSEDAESWQS